MDLRETEQHLLDQYNNPTVPRSQAIQEIYQLLSQQDCWWCQHYDLACCMLEVLQHQHSPVAQQIWLQMSEQLSNCTNCINSYHQAQMDLFGDFQHSRSLLTVLLQLDKQRLLSWAATQLAPVEQQLASPLSTPQLYALFELLGYSHYLDDAELCAAGVTLLEQAGWALECGGVPYAGMFRLLAHQDADVRAKALSVVKPMGPLDNMADAGANLSEVLDCWLTALQQQSPQGPSSHAAQHQELLQPGQQQQWPRQCVWSALKAVMGMLQGDCLSGILALYPQLLPAILAQANPAVYLTGHAGGSLSDQQQAMAAVLPGLYLAADGSLEQKHALGCLHSLLLGLQYELWQFDTAAVSPQQVVQHLEGSLWAAVRLKDTPLLKTLLQTLQALAQALLPCLQEEGTEAVAVSDDEQDSEEQPTDTAAGGQLPALECKDAVLHCLRVLLVQLPGSAVVPLLTRGLALEAGLTVCLSALQSPSCPGTAVFAHLWAPVAAALLVVPLEQYSSLQGQALQQHQAPGIAQMLPVLAQMQDLQDRVMEAAAGLVATALQADAAVLHSALSKQQSGAAANNSWLVPSALDVVELSLNSSNAYKCAPSMWQSLAGCGNAVVSASFVAAAAQLVPLGGPAVAHSSRMQAVWPLAQQQLDNSLVLPDPERVDPRSTVHAVFAVESAGWLHQQFIRAAVRHLHFCNCRSRLFLLPLGIRALAKSPGQATIDGMFRQLSASTSPPPDSTAAAAYALAVRGCVTLMVQGKAGSMAVLAAEAEHALLSSCGVPLGAVKAAVQQHLLAPGSMCAEGVIQALQEELQRLMDQSSITKVVLKAPEQLATFLDLSGFSLGAAIRHGIDVMLPLFASYLPGLWQLSMDALTSGCKLITSSKACAACAATLPGQQAAAPRQQQQGSHTGPGVGAVLHALLDVLPAMWQSYQALITQRCEQRQLYLDAADDEEESLTPLSIDGTPRQGPGSAKSAVAAELHRQSSWLVQLLVLGRHMHSNGRSSPAEGCPCIRESVADRRLRLAWRACLEDVVKATRSALPKAVKAAATELMQSEEPGLDQLWLAQLFPSAAPGNLASSGLGSWPSRLTSPAHTATATQAPAATAGKPVVPAAAAAGAAGGAGSSGLSKQPSFDPDDYVLDLVGDCSEDCSEDGDQPAGEAAGSDSDDVIIIDSSEEEAEQQQQQGTHFSPPKKPSGSQAWPWLRRQQPQQQQSHQGLAAAQAELLQQKQATSRAVAQLLQDHEVLPAAEVQQQHRDRRQASASVAAAAAQLFKQKQPQTYPWATTPHSSSTASATQHMQPDRSQQQQGVGSMQGPADEDLQDEDQEGLWPEEWKDTKGAPAPEAYPGYRYNRPPERPRKQAPPPQGISKGAQVRMELLGRAPAQSDEDEAALAAELIAAAGVRGSRRRATPPPAAAAAGGTGQQQLQQLQQQQQQQQLGSTRSRGGAGRQDALTAAGKAAVRKAAAQLVQQQRQLHQQEELQERWLQRQQEEQQQARLRAQQQQAREKRKQQQAEAAKAAEEAAAAEKTAAGRAGISLISDDALFKQAAAAAAANRPKPQPVRTAATVRHQGPIFLRSAGTPAMGFGRGAVRPPSRQYPVLRLDAVWSELLSWGYQGAVGSSSQRGSGAAAASAAATRKLLQEGRVPLHFDSVGHYVAVFRGLLLEELRAGLCAAHEEQMSGSSSGPSARGGGFKSLPLMIESVQRQSKVCVIVAQVDTRDLPPRERDCPRSEDYVVLTRVQLAIGSDLGEERLPRSHLSGLVVDTTTLQPGLRQVTLHVVPESAGSEVMAQFWRQLLAPRSELWVSVITSLVPNFREFQALIALQHALQGDRLLKVVLDPQPPRASAISAAGTDSSQQLAQLPPGLSQALRSAYNPSQCGAVGASLDQRLPFVLVQGPPGTGKTSAIVGMLSALLGAAEGQRGGSRAHGSAARGRGAAAAGRQGSAVAAGAGTSLPAQSAQSALKLGVAPRVRVLVCAQSNAAIDELIIRLANTGVWCGSGGRRAPGMVRMGRSDAMHSSILIFHVDALADAAVQQQAQERAKAAAAGLGIAEQQEQGAGAGAAAGAEGSAQAAAEHKVQELRERLQEVELQLAAVAKQQGAQQVGVKPSTGVLPALQDKQHGLAGQKRSSVADKGTEGPTAAAGSMPPPPNKQPRAAGDADVATRRLPAPAEPDDSGSDMELSSGSPGAAPAGAEQGAVDSRAGQQQQQRQAGTQPHSRGSRGDRSRSGSPARHRGRSGDPSLPGPPDSGPSDGSGGRSSRSHSGGSSRRESRRSKSPDKHHKTGSKEHRSSSGGHKSSRRSHSRSRSPGRSRRKRSRSSEQRRDRDKSSKSRREDHSRGSRSPERRWDRDSSSRRRREEHGSGSRAQDGPDRDSRTRESGRQHSSSSRGRGRTEDDDSSRAAVGEQTGRSGTAEDEGVDRGQDSRRGWREGSSSDRAEFPDIRSGHSRDADRPSSENQDIEQRRGRPTDSNRAEVGRSSSAQADRAGRDSSSVDDSKGAELHGTGAVAARTSQPQHRGGGQEASEEHQRQQQQAAAAASASLLRDQQRALLAELRCAEQELQQTDAPAPRAADRRELDRARKGARQAVIQAAEVVLCTLSAAGGDLLNAFPAGAGPLFDVVVVDEAAQALEPATLIPLQHIKPGSGRVVLVGDPCQLPPTVLSKAAEASMLAQSLFERLARAGWPVNMLLEQYRSHPAISAFPSRFFYQGQLLNGAGVDAVSKGALFHAQPVYGPMVVWDCQEGRERGGGAGSRGGGSLQNPAEAELAATLVAGLLSSYRADVGSIAVISPYRAQVACLRHEFRRQLGGDAGLAAANIEFGTVDGFQGREADVVVFSCVRAQPEAAAAAAAAAAGGAGGAGGQGGAGPRIGFLQDVRRMNVGLTRGRRAVWVLCHADTLFASPAWRPLLKEAQGRGVLLQARYPFRRLLTATDRQLRGSYWTPHAAAAVLSQGSTPTAAAAVLPAAALPAAALPAAAVEADKTRAPAANGPANAAGTAATAAAAVGTDKQAGNVRRPPQPLQAGPQLPPTQAAAPRTTAAAAAAAAAPAVAKRPAAKAQAKSHAAAAAAGPPVNPGGLGPGDVQPIRRVQGKQAGPTGVLGGGAAANRAPSSAKAVVQPKGRPAAAAAAAAPARPQATRHAGGLDAEAAAWAAADAARAAATAGSGSKAAAAAGRKPAAGTAAAAAAGSKPDEAKLRAVVLKRTQQQQAAGGRAAAAAGEGRPLAEAAKSSARRTVLRPGRETPAAVRQQQQQQGATQQWEQQRQQVAAGGQRNGAAGRTVANAGRGPAQARHGPAGGRGPAPAEQQQQQRSQAELRAALLARINKSGHK